MTAIIASIFAFAAMAQSMGGPGDGAWEEWADYRCDKV